MCIRIYRKLRELQGHPKSLNYHNIIGDNKCDGLKKLRIGQSAAEFLRNEKKVQRLTYTVQNGL